MHGGIDYLLIGHVCRDITPDGPRLGGTVTFSALTAHALGLRVGILTSSPNSMNPLLRPLHGTQMARIPSERPTTFQNDYTPQGRVQTLLGRARDLTWERLPAAWHNPPIVHLAPVADEVAPSFVKRFPHALVGVTPQGWLRRWDSDGRVVFKEWENAPDVIRYAQAIVLSIDDIQGDEALAEQYARYAKALVVTRGRAGCKLYIQGQSIRIAAPKVVERDPTGAGDIFAAAFFARLKATEDPIRAAQFATILASYSVTRVGIESIPTNMVIEAAMSEILPANDGDSI